MRSSLSPLGVRPSGIQAAPNAAASADRINNIIDVVTISLVGLISRISLISRKGFITGRREGRGLAVEGDEGVGLRAEAYLLGVADDVGAVLAVDAVDEGLAVVAGRGLVVEYEVEARLVESYGVE